ncbi:uncharacterized protein BDV17DRAFT_260790 [Aspergillus undulatus]|uniref:uncharacterized protein n=1 Tax=Aspergillus undulatus TaxID=1810928 RepID=UPI003CCDB86B
MPSTSPLTIAIAGSGDLTRYISEELLSRNHNVILLVRSEKPHFKSIPNLVQETVDYTSVNSLTNALNKHNAIALISTILTYDTQAFISTHENLIAAAIAAKTVIRFIPSEYGVNIRDYPDQPGFYWETREPIRRLLRAQNSKEKKLEYTLICCGWLLDYIVPKENRYMKDIGDAFPVNIAEKRAVIPGIGKELVDFISARDLAKGLVRLLEVPSGMWEEYVFLSGEQLSCDQLVEAVRTFYGWNEEGEFEVKYLSLRELVNEVRDARDEFGRIEAEYMIVIPSGSAALDGKVVKAHREKYFSDVKFRGVREVLEISRAGEGEEVIV